MASSFNISDSSVANLFKHQYEKISMDMYNGDMKTLGRIKKSYDCVGDQVERPIPLGFQGGAGSGSLPDANRGNYAKAIFSTKSVYAVCDVDRRTIKQSKDSGAFVDALKESVKRTVIKFNWNASRILYNDGTGALGTIDSGGVSGSYSIVISAATWKLANWEIRDFVQFGTSTDKFEITAITPSSRTIAVTRLTGTYVPVAADVVYLQGSRNNDPQGLKGVCDATSSTLYSVNVQYRWQSSQVDASSAGITTDLMNQVMLDVEATSSEVPTDITTSFVQMRKLLNQVEDQKRYPMTGTEVKSRYGNFSFPGVQFMSTAGPVSIMTERFCEDDRMYFLNTDNIESCHAPDFGWCDDEGFVFLRKAGTDQYEARYAGYYETYIVPTLQGRIKNLAT